MSGKGSSGGVAKIAEPFVCGGSAATFASIVIHPMDLAKVSVIAGHSRCTIALQIHLYGPF